MYSEGNILFFTPFHFKNGNIPAKKFFVVLKVVDNTTILASLPSSKDFIPKDQEVESGCIELPDININCFVISAGIPITECGKCFDVTTFIYGSGLDSYDIEYMNKKYAIEGVDFRFFGKMKKEIFSELLCCLKSSKVVRKKFVKMLSE